MLYTKHTYISHMHVDLLISVADIGTGSLNTNQSTSVMQGGSVAI